jgi:hypothetical protein
LFEKKKPKPKYIWRIDHNYLQGQPCNIVGPQNADKKLLDGPGQAFKMFDDDGELFFAGTLYGHFTGFEPLEDFGREGYGCTEIHIEGKRL